MDIRKFFAPKATEKGQDNRNNVSGAKAKDKGRVTGSKSKECQRPKPSVVSDSSSEDEKRIKPSSSRATSGRHRKRATQLDSSEDEFEAPPVKKTVAPLQSVDPKDYFKHKPDKKNEKNGESTVKKRKSPDSEFHDDAEFTELLVAMDRQARPAPKAEDPGLQRSSKKAKQSNDSKNSDSGAEAAKCKATKLFTSTCVSIPEKTKPCRVDSVKDSSSQSSTEAGFELWVDKYKPSNVKNIIGQQGDKSNMRKLMTWIQDWSQNHSASSGQKPPSKPPPWNAGADNGAWAKAALLSGPPGVGKTTTAYLVAKELGYDVMELNASDTRSKKQLEAMVTDAVSSKSLCSWSSKRILLMDEVDGMAGNEDRGGVAELIHLIKRSKIPIVCMCNDRNHTKIRSLANHCFDLRFQKPRVEQIRAAMMSICFKEKLKGVTPDMLNEIISGCNQDIRQVLHQLSMLKAACDQDTVTMAGAKRQADQAKKTSIKMGPWDVCRKVFSSNEHSTMSLTDKSDLFFHDYSLAPLFVQENYLSVMPDAAKKDPKKAIILASKAAESLCDADAVEKLIRTQNNWSLLPVDAMFASVLPGEYMSGYMQGQIQFPNWLGKNSKQGKTDRTLQELQIHTRLSAGLSKRALNLDFAQCLRDSIVRPMVLHGPDGVHRSVQLMQHYALLRDDLDNLLEVTQWPESSDPMKSVESKVKSAFTRAYNKVVMLPYATSLGTIGRKTSMADENAALLDPHTQEEEEAEEEQQDDQDNIEADSMIKAKKITTKSAAAATASGSAVGQGGKSRGRGRARGRGRGGQ